MYKFKKMLLLNLAIASFTIVSAQNKNIVQGSQLTFPGKETSNIWGYKSPAGNEYALVGTTTGMSIVDVTNPTVPTLLHNIPGANSDWREIRTQNNFAYVTTEGGGGITIVNLSNLPAVPVFKQYTGSGAIAGQLNKVHSLHVAENKLYLHGSNLSGGGTLVFSLADPYNPVYLGSYSNRYVHDGFVKNNILYAGEILDGFMTVLDFTNPAAPVELASLTTPSAFTHNTWMSTDEKTIFTTDEVSGSYVTAYDITNLNNITEVGRYRHDNSGSVGHNTYVLNDSLITGFNKDFVITSYYRDGITIVDATDPSNMIEIGNFDSSPFAGPGFNGAWGVYPFLPSGNLLISDIEEGLFVVTPTYVPASRLKGIVSDSISGATINNVSIELVSTGIQTKSKLNGTYKTGIAANGVYSIIFSKIGFESKTINNVSLSSGNVTNLDVELKPLQSYTFGGQVLVTVSNALVPGINVQLSNSLTTITATTNSNSQFNFPSVFPGFYEIQITKWGFLPIFDTITISTQSQTRAYSVTRGYVDNFNTNLGWTNTSTASTGAWVRDFPLATFLNGQPSNPGNDASGSGQCFITGNAGGGAGNDDVDNGSVILTSPSFDLTDHINPVLTFSRWFVNGGGSGNPNDYMTISISNGFTKVIVENITSTTIANGTWQNFSVPISSIIQLTANMKLEIIASDDVPGHIVEAGLDQFEIKYDALTVGFNNLNAKNSNFLKVIGNPSSRTIQFKYELSANPDADSRVKIYNAFGQLMEEIKIISKEGKFESVQNLPSGLYTITLLTQNSKTSQKAILINN